MSRAEDVREWISAFVADAGGVPVGDLEQALALRWRVGHRAAFRLVRDATSWPGNVIRIRLGVAYPAKRAQLPAVAPAGATP